MSTVMPERLDCLYGDFTTSSHLLPAERPWLYRIGDLVRVGEETVQIIDGFLHVNRAVGSRRRGFTPTGSRVYIIRAVSTGEMF